MPKVENGYLHLYAEAFPLESVRWYSWLMAHKAFYFQSPIGTFTARKEIRREQWYWYAYRKDGKKSHNMYLGRSQELTAARLLEIAQQLTDKIEQSN